MSVQPFQMFDRPQGDVIDALRDSIERVGVLVPVLKDQHGRTLDGHTREAICAELGITDYPVHVVEVEDEETGWQVAATVNALRRHLSPDQRRQVVGDLRALGHSLRAIAAATGVSLGTVQRDLARPGVSPDTPEAVTGLDGKSYEPTRPAATVTETTTTTKTVDIETGEIAPESASATAAPEPQPDAAVQGTASGPADAEGPSAPAGASVAEEDVPSSPPRPTPEEKPAKPADLLTEADKKLDRMVGARERAGRLWFPTLAEVLDAGDDVSRWDDEYARMEAAVKAWHDDRRAQIRGINGGRKAAR